MAIIEEKIVNTIRMLSADGVEKANSGHPGMPMGAAPMAFALWRQHLKGSATEPTWVDRDRFVLSAGHGSMLQYALLHLFGYEVSLEAIQNFRQWESITPGHPEYGMTPGVEATTGPLGQGLSMAVGMALAEARLAAKFNTPDIEIVDHYTFAIAGDGCLMEGITSEASSLAGHLKLGKLVVLYDDNQITIDGSTSIAFTEDVTKRYEAYGWQVLEVADGNDLSAIDQALIKAKATLDQPSLIRVKTVIGFGSPSKAGTAKTHGSPLGHEDLRGAKLALGLDPDKMFQVDEDVKEAMKQLIDQREMARFAWEEKFAKYQNAYPDKAEEWFAWHDYHFEEDAFEDPDLWQAFLKDDATRNSGGLFMNHIQALAPNLIGGSADLNGSTKTYLKGAGDFQATSRDASNIFYGVREHAMGAVMNGMALHGGLRPYGATFLVFSDYMKPAIRLSALMKLPVIYVFTHDSIGVGEDGPTHQPIEHLLMLRSIPNTTVFRPADPKETAICWVEALKNTDGPSVIILTRQTVPALEGVHRGAHLGAYVISPSQKEKPEGLLIGTGSEVHLLIEAQKLLALDGHDVSVISMPSREVFKKQTSAYQASVLPQDIRKRVVMEAATSMGWHDVATDTGLVIGIDHFGESAPAETLFKAFGLTAEHAVSAYKKL